MLRSPPTTCIGTKSESGVGEREDVSSDTEGARLRFKEDVEGEGLSGDRATVRVLGGNTCMTRAENLSPCTSMNTPVETFS